MIAATAASGLLQLALLHPEILLLLDQQLERLEVLQLRAEFPVVERPADVHPLLDHREGRFELGDGRGGGRALRLLLRALLVERGDLGAVLGYLADQKLALHGDQLRARAFGRPEIDRGILGIGQRGPEPGNVELGRDQVALRCGRARRGSWSVSSSISTSPALTAMPSRTWMARTTPVS